MSIVEEHDAVSFETKPEDTLNPVQLQQATYLPQNIVIAETPRLWKENEPYRCAPPNRSDPWVECLKCVGKYDDGMCKGWREDIDTLLVFAGLFSAVVTAFTTESYRWLQPDPQDFVLAQLIHISQHLNGTTSPAIPSPQTEFEPSPASVRINAFWFLSLTISLATVLIGILCKQWLREYQQDASVSRQFALELRQMRYESLQKWGVPVILASLPLLLQVALVLFFAGMLDLLWSLHPIVASLVSTVVGLSLCIVGVTTLLPTCYMWLLRRQSLPKDIFPCPYKSPQSWLFHRLVLVIRALGRNRRVSMKYTDWASFDLHCLRAQQYLYLHDSDTFLRRGLRWVVATFGDSSEMARHIFHCLQDCSTQDLAYATQEDAESSRDSLNAKFVESHCQWDEPDFAIRKFTIESSLRQLNDSTSSTVGASTLLRKLATLIDHDEKVDLGDELWHQIIAAIRNHVGSDRACVDDVFPLLEIFESCWHSSSQSLQKHAFIFLDDFQSWIERTTQPGLRRARVSETVCWMTGVIHYMVHYFSTDLLASSRFCDFARFLDNHILSLPIDLQSLHTGRSTWQEAKQTLLIRSRLPADYFRTPEDEEDEDEDEDEDGDDFVTSIFKAPSSLSRTHLSPSLSTHRNDTAEEITNQSPLPPDSRSSSIEKL